MVMADKELIAWLYKLYNTLIKEEGHYAKAVTTGLAIDRLEELVATKEALTEQLAAARRDAEEAEAYAVEVEAERRKTYEALLKVTRIHDEVEAKLAEQIEWVKRLADDLIAAEEHEARLKEKLAKAVDVLEKIAKFDHQKEAQRILTMTVEQPAAMHLRAEKSEERVQAEYQLIKSVAQTDIQCWAHMAITELTGGKDE